MAREKSRTGRSDERTRAFAANLSSILARKGWQQTELANRTPLSRDAINRYCNGVSFPPLAKVAMIAAALGVSPLELDPEFPEEALTTFAESQKNEEKAGFLISAAPSGRPGMVLFFASLEISAETSAEIVKLLSANRTP